MTSRFDLSSSAWMGSSFASGAGVSDDDSAGFSAAASVVCHLRCSLDEMCDVDGYDSGVTGDVRVDNDRADGSGEMKVEGFLLRDCTWRCNCLRNIV
jgi:hypothetical protein